MKVIRILGLICLSTIGVFSQNTARIEGKVIQKSDAAPNFFFKDAKETIQNKTVTLMSKVDNKTVAETKTDIEGNFVFEDIPFGSYWIFVDCSYCWRGSVREEITVVAAQSLKLEIELQRVGIRETVTISADSEQPLDQVSKSVNIIDAQEMRDRADFSLAETLRTIPGFRVQQLGGFGRVATIKTRGLRNQDTALLLDGVRFRDAASITGDATPFLSDFTLTSVSKIEVLRGSGSSLYGTNAIGGTIDFQTPVPKPAFHGQISGAFGGLGLGRFRGNISDGTNDGKFAFNLAVSRTVYTKGIDGEDNAHNTNFQSRIEYNPFSKTNVSARFFVSDAYVRLNSNPDTVLDGIPSSNAGIIDAAAGINFTPDLNDPNSIQNSQFFNGQVVLTQIVNDQLSFQVHYSGLKTSRKNTNPSSLSVFDGTIQTANAHFNWAPNSVNKITGGYEFEHEKYGNDGLTPNGSGNFFTRGFQSSSTLFAQDLVQFFEGRLQLASGFRAQFFSLADPEFSLLNAPYSNLTLDNPPTAYTFDGSASYYFPKTGTKIRIHIGNGYRVPSLFERFGTFFSTFFGPEFVALGDPNLGSEKTLAFDAGIEQNLFGERAKLSAVYFYTKLIDTIGFGNVVPDIGATPRPFGGYLNTKGGIARGAEFSGDARPTSSTSIFASYTFTNSDQSEPQVVGNTNLKTLGIPDHQFTLVATQRFKRFWINFDLLATSTYLAPIFDTNNFSFQSYVYRFKGNRKADLTAGYTFLLNKDRFNLRLYGTIENLLDYEYFENGFRTGGRTARAGVSFGF